MDTLAPILPAFVGKLPTASKMLMLIESSMHHVSHASVVKICRDAAMMTMRRKISGRSPEEIKTMKKEDLDLPITAKDFDDALARCKKSVSETDVKRYEKWLKQFGSQ